LTGENVGWRCELVDIIELDQSAYGSAGFVHFMAPPKSS
jgi:hypothetical protein